MTNNYRQTRTQLRRTVFRFAALLLLFAPSFPGCSAVSSQPIGLSTDGQVTEGLGDIAATGDTSRCDEYGCPDLSCVPEDRPPAELTKMSLPTYRIEPPDILMIRSIKASGCWVGCHRLRSFALPTTLE